MADERIATFASVTGCDAGFAARALRVRATRATREGEMLVETVFASVSSNDVARTRARSRAKTPTDDARYTWLFLAVTGV
jgi:hypothetical protein